MAQGTDGEAFATSRQNFEEVVGFLGSSEAGALSHAELEERLFASGRELLRQLYQDHLDLRCLVEEPLNDVCDQAGVRRPDVETGHRRALATVFGDVVVDRLAYRQKGQANLHVADAVLNLPTERHSHGLRRLAAIESARGSFEEASEAVERATGTSVGKRQVEALAARAAGDVVEFYATRRCPEAAGDDVLVISADGKGIVMRPDSLRPATAKAAAEATTKLDCRLSKGEKRNRKRLAEVGAVYDLTPVERTPADVMASNSDQTPAPVAKAKWVTASVIDDAASVIAKVFDEAERRDPEHQRPVGGPRRRQQPPDRPHRDRGHHTRSRGHRRGRFHPRLGVPLGRGVVLLRRGRTCCRGLGPRPGGRGTRGQRPQGRCRYQAEGHGYTARQAQANQGGRLRQVPDQQGRLLGLPDGARLWLADRKRRHRDDGPILPKRVAPLVVRWSSPTRSTRWSARG